jgi:muramoyltetrapeptide carboxypeptidase
LPELAQKRIDLDMTELKKPPRLHKKDLIGVVAPAGAFRETDFLSGIDFLRQQGFQVRYRDDITARSRYFAGNDERRAEELKNFLIDPEIKAIFCARGGYGTQRTIPH